ncbi:MAG: flavodoxin family protein [Firmicutes bacterium]|nr:flavodoxin family protein [Bacillota bacterium]
MQVVIHDLSDEHFAKIWGVRPHVVSKRDKIHHCLGCFGCWTRTPGACVIRDAYGDLGALLGSCDQVLIISECCYGGFSPFVKNVLDRSISYVHPYFTSRDGEMHHRRRYNNQVSLEVQFYGEVTEKEKYTAGELVKANARNLWWDVAKVSFCKDLSALGGQGS